jgi:transcriptional regulator with XRE-family HTH domain
MATVKTALGQKLRELRGQNTLYSIAEQMGIHRRQLKYYEDGRMPDDEPLEKIAAFYDIPFEDLKKLAFEAMFPPESRDRNILVDWVRGLINQQ